MKINIVGRGNVASHLFKAFSGCDKVEVSIINPHTLEGIERKSDLILISVSDDAIPEVASRLGKAEAVVAHTSGSVSLQALAGVSAHIGVFYPLQTFTKDVPLDYNEIPVFLEFSDEEAQKILREAAEYFSEDIRIADSESRRKLHLASVFACNFTNALAGAGCEILADSGIDFSALLPLLRQTIKKLETLSPAEAQTGPAARGDHKVMERHIEMLSGHPLLQSLYRDLSSLIQERP